MTRPSSAIQSEANQLALQLGMLRGEYLHRERQLTDRLANIEAELTAALDAEKQQTPGALHERLAAVEAALTNQPKDS